MRVLALGASLTRTALQLRGGPVPRSSCHDFEGQQLVHTAAVGSSWSGAGALRLGAGCHRQPYIGKVSTYATTRWQHGFREPWHSRFSRLLAGARETLTTAAGRRRVLRSVATLTARRTDPGRPQLTNEYLTTGTMVVRLPLEYGGYLNVTAHKASEQNTWPVPEASSDSFEEWRVLRFEPAEGTTNLLQSITKVCVLSGDDPDSPARLLPGVMPLEYTKSLAAIICGSLVALGAPVLPLPPSETGSSTAMSPPLLRVLCIGLGGGSVPSFLADALPHCQVEVVELEAAVVQAATEGLGFQTGPNLSIEVADGIRVAIREALAASRGSSDAGAYDAVLIDAYDAAGDVPAALRSTDGSPNIGEALAAGLLRERGGLLVTNFLPHVDLMQAYKTYHSSLPAELWGPTFSVEAQGSGNLQLVQFAGKAGCRLNDASVPQLCAMLRRCATQVEKAVGCRFDMGGLVARNLQRWGP